MRLAILSLRGLTRRKVRTTLCLLGIALGVSVILGVGTATTRYTATLREMNTYFQGRVVVVSSRSIFIQALPIGGVLPGGIVAEIERVEGVGDAVPMLVLVRLPQVGEGGGLGLTQLVPMNITYGIAGGRWGVLVGSTPLRAGRWPDPGGEEVVIGRYLAERNNLTVGSEIRVEGHAFRVVGVLETSSPFLTRVIIMSLEMAQRTYGYPRLINMVVVKPEEGVSEEELADRIEAEISGVSALTSEERGELTEGLFRDVELWNLGLRTILYLMSMVLVATVMTMNISERRKELATLDAIGAPRGFVLRMVSGEGALLGLLGGLLGLLLGSIASILLVSRYASVPIAMVFKSLLDVVPPKTALEILASTVAVSTIASAVPTLLAQRGNIVDALRAEP